MDVLVYLVPIALLLGLGGLIAFMWALSSGQLEDLDGAAERILFDDDELPLNQPAGERAAGLRQQRPQGGEQDRD